MNLGFEIVPVDEGPEHNPKRTLWTIHFRRQSYSEYDQFLQDADVLSDENFNEVLGKVDDMVNRTGFMPWHFNDISNPDNSICELKRGNLRLFCWRPAENLSIVGSGGIKTTRTYQEDKILWEKVKRLEYFDSRYYARMQESGIKIDVVSGKVTFVGNLRFEEE